MFIKDLGGAFIARPLKLEEHMQVFHLMEHLLFCAGGTNKLPLATRHHLLLIAFFFVTFFAAFCSTNSAYFLSPRLSRILSARLS